MEWRILIGIAVLVGVGSAITEYDNIPLETSQAAQSRQIAQRPVYTASYGVAPGEYVLRGSDEQEAKSPAPVQGFGYLPREQNPPQEYLDLLRQAGAADAETPQQPQQQQNVESQVLDQQYFGAHSGAPYPGSGITPVSSLNLPPSPTQYSHTEDVEPQTPSPPISGYPSRRNQVAPANFASSSLYVTPLPDTAPVNYKKSKPIAIPSTRKAQGAGRTRFQDDSRQGSGKAVQRTYSLDYNLRTLHTEGDSANRAPSVSAPYYPNTPGTVVKGDEDLLSKLAPAPEPLPFPLSGSRNTKKSKSKQSNSPDYDDDEQKIEVIKLPTPKDQRPITQEELNELIRAGYDVSPAGESQGQAYQPSQPSPAPQNPQGYPRNSAPQHQLRLPKSRTAEAEPQATRYLSSTKTQERSNTRSSKPRQNSYLRGSPVTESAGDVGYSYQTPRPLPLNAAHQKTVEPNVQAYQPGRSGIQEVNEHQVGQQAPQEEDYPQTYSGSYIPQGYPTAAAPEQPLIPQVQNYPTVAPQDQPQQDYQRVSAEQAQLYHHQQLAQQEAQIYQQPQTTETRNEALSQPKEYVIPAPQRTKGYGSRVNQGYGPTAPSTIDNEDTFAYHQASVSNQQQGYETVPTVPGVSAALEVTPNANTQVGEGYGRRNSRKRPSSQHESRVTYIRRYQGHTTAYTTEQ
ncbi:uncharacterized protein [Hetaerina americana]|uniref:uncharacterized protein n=1 Tax=Hetaerina americana TaxID=62018 RepID=UPI003A7F311A